MGFHIYRLLGTAQCLKLDTKCVMVSFFPSFVRLTFFETIVLIYNRCFCGKLATMTNTHNQMWSMLTIEANKGGANYPDRDSLVVQEKVNYKMTREYIERVGVSVTSTHKQTRLRYPKCDSKCRYSTKDSLRS